MKNRAGRCKSSRFGYKLICLQMKIGKMVKERLEIPENQTIVFNVHKVVIPFNALLNHFIFKTAFIQVKKGLFFMPPLNSFTNWQEEKTRPGGNGKRRMVV